MANRCSFFYESQMPDQNDKPYILELIVAGKVQGVGFRRATRREGERLGLRVTATNLDDGTVRIEAEGSGDSVARLMNWAHHGPPSATVTTVDVIRIEERTSQP